MARLWIGTHTVFSCNLKLQITTSKKQQQQQQPKWEHMSEHRVGSTPQDQIISNSRFKSLVTHCVTHTAVVKFFVMPVNNNPLRWFKITKDTYASETISSDVGTSERRNAAEWRSEPHAKHTFHNLKQTNKTMKLYVTATEYKVHVRLT